MEEDDGQGQLEAVGEDVDQGRGQRHHPAPASFRIIMLLQCTKISELLVKVGDDDRLTGGGEDHLHVGLGLHLSLSIVTCAVGSLGLKMINIIFLVIFSVLQLVIFLKF